jgi:TonB family protein
MLLVALALLVLPGGPLAPRAFAGTPRLQVFFAADFTDTAYQQKIYQKVAASWKRPSEAPATGKKAVVIAHIRKDGKIPEPVLHLKSGSEAWDTAALEAVRSAAPFDALPAAYARPSVEVHFHFEYGP